MSFFLKFWRKNNHGENQNHFLKDKPTRKKLRKLGGGAGRALWISL